MTDGVEEVPFDGLRVNGVVVEEAPFDRLRVNGVVYQLWVALAPWTGRWRTGWRGVWPMR